MSIAWLVWPLKYWLNWLVGSTIYMRDQLTWYQWHVGPVPQTCLVRCANKRATPSNGRINKQKGASWESSSRPITLPYGAKPPRPNNATNTTTPDKYLRALPSGLGPRWDEGTFFLLTFYVRRVGQLQGRGSVFVCFFVGSLFFYFCLYFQIYSKKIYYKKLHIKHLKKCNQAFENVTCV